MASSEITSTSSEQLTREIRVLRTRLAEAEQKLAEAQEQIRAIQRGDVDAVVVAGRDLTPTDITERERTAVDPTTHQQAKDTTRTNQATLEAALASMTDSVLITDADGRFVDFNHAFATFYRFKSKEECVQNFDQFASLFEIFLANGEPLPRETYAI